MGKSFAKLSIMTFAKKKSKISHHRHNPRREDDIFKTTDTNNFGGHDRHNIIKTSRKTYLIIFSVDGRTNVYSAFNYLYSEYRVMIDRFILLYILLLLL